MTAYATTKDLRAMALYNADGRENVMYGMTSEQCDAFELFASEKPPAEVRQYVTALRRYKATNLVPHNFADQWREGYERMTRGAG